MPADVGSPGGLADLQRAMVRAVHGDRQAFASVTAAIDDDGLGANKRLFLHLNTITHALTGVLRQAYPATAGLLGAERFETLARGFLRAAPPQRAELSAYGAGFDRFLVAEGALAEPLAAVARLDWAVQEAYFAADAEPLTAAALAAIPEERQAALGFALVPSARLLPLPAALAWRRWVAFADRGVVAIAEAPGRPDSGPAPVPAAALVWRRPDLTVAARPLSVGELVCLAALAAGESLLDAAAGAEATAEFDLAALLTDGLAGGLFDAAPPGGP
ncbi:hypothetical protein SAMN06265365_103129 [Tistlia consotensis]|uniref:Putative DNA-binding domain-containing protein n=1 Tax=Tistlia consotensis USBA 355 TaxID=560819 RepID=A0A1Y6BSC3_9PROT|nr:putative DNA-binding domain-containing protein [Tistlia consotensis]SMF17383.1 hypothetical protein SAMN05428998_10698 [Tistlia consotensis USBA 355]SNR40477.1 hypothetical protein SAMN06265365_103129 [Tistlia consotensis]